MKTVIIANPHASAGSVHQNWSKLNRIIVACFGPSEIHFTQASGEATSLTRKAIMAGAERIVAVGGDGTLNEVVNGFFEGQTFLGRETVLAYYPIGTGCDFARSVGLKTKQIESALHTSEVRRIDVGRVTFKNHEDQDSNRYFINICSFGMSGLTDSIVNRSDKRFGGRFAFFKGVLQSLMQYRNQKALLTIDDHFNEELTFNTIAVANGRFFGGGMQIAPTASLNDGLLDVVIVGDMSIPRFLWRSHKVYRGTHLDSPNIRLIQGKKIIATPLVSEPVLIDVDGEQPGKLPIQYEVLPRILSMYAPFSKAPAYTTLVNQQKTRENHQ